jgi:hypothetical protein
MALVVVVIKSVKENYLCSTLCQSKRRQTEQEDSQVLKVNSRRESKPGCLLM